jgi:hypothetical protein
MEDKADSNGDEDNDVNVDDGDANDGRLPRPTASFSYLADPVCSYLAMQFMNEKWSLKATDREFRGYPKKSG